MGTNGGCLEIFSANPLAVGVGRGRYRSKEQTRPRRSTAATGVVAEDRTRGNNAPGIVRETEWARLLLSLASTAIEVL